LLEYSELTCNNSGLALRSKFEEFGQVQEAVCALHLSTRDPH